MNFSTKARTLESLIGSIKAGHVAPLLIIQYSAWSYDRVNVLLQVRSFTKSGDFIVRSSCRFEDQAHCSAAGKYLSLLNVAPQAVEQAIEEVFSSYGEPHLNDEVLIQPMLENVVRSGVVFSHDPNTCSPYYVVNWSNSVDTAAITSGTDNGQTWIGTGDAEAPEDICTVIPLVEELLEKFKQQAVDIEFAITKNKNSIQTWLLQVRPLILKMQPITKLELKRRLDLIAQKIERGMIPHPFLLGRRTAFGVMPDWNPAEIIGIRPKPLSHSLYRDLVTDSIWAYQRNNYGYRNLRSHPLMPNFFNQPYIDVRLSFNSFIPADLDEGIASRLVDYYIDRLITEPYLHDKVEFDIVYSCYTLDLPKRMQKLVEFGFSKEEILAIQESLRSLTNKIIHPEDGLWKKDAEKLDILNSRRDELLSSNANHIEKIYWLLEDAKRYGTLPFAGLARAGFIAVQLLQSLVEVNVLNKEDYDQFMSSITTVSGQLSRDMELLDRVTFLSKYGHLRPGTYDVQSLRYDEDPNHYFDWENKKSGHKPNSFSLTLVQMKKLAKLLEEHGLHPDVVGLFDFLQGGIELRELSKFHFTRNLSDALALIVDFVKHFGISRDEIAFCDISVFRELYLSSADPEELIKASIKRGKIAYQESLQITLPPLITKPVDAYGFTVPDSSPNFITQKTVVAEVTEYGNKSNLAGKIVCIPNADPGFDWLFSYEISGLITAWGGVNSHMSIRAGELGIPAVIGAGEKHYHKWSGSSKLRIDCASKHVEVLS